MMKLLGWLVLVLVTWAVYHRVSNQLTPRSDTALVGVIAIVSFGCVLVQLIWTWRWRALSLGLLSFFLATGLLYTRVSAGGWNYNLWLERPVLSLIRALYLVGAILTAAGLMRWAAHNLDRAFPWWRHTDGRDPFVPQGDE